MAKRNPVASKDRQAEGVILAINEVARQVERRWQRYVTLSEEGRARTASELLADVDRLTNLIDLVEAGDGAGRTDSQRQMLREVASVRQRLSAVGVSLMLERIKAIRGAAEDVAEMEEHPLGKSISLRDDFLRYVNYLRRFAGDRFSSEDSACVMETAQYINMLAARDRQSPWLRSFAIDDGDVVSDISLQTLAMFADSLGEDDGEQEAPQGDEDDGLIVR